MFCSHCGAQLPDDARFCTGCGAQLQQEPPSASLSPSHDFQAPDPLPLDSFHASAPIQPAQSSTPSGTKRKMGLLIALIAGGALLLAAAVFFGIRLLGSRSDADNASAQSTMEDTAEQSIADEHAAFPSLPAYALPPESTARPASEDPTQGDADGNKETIEQPGIGALSELESTLPGLWLSEPDSDGDRSLVFIDQQAFGSALAFPKKGAVPDTFPEGFDVRLFQWYGYRVEGDTLYLIDHDGFEIGYDARVISNDEIKLDCEDEYLSLLHPRLHRVGEGEPPPLLWFVQGGWVAQNPDDSGNHVAMQFSPDGDTYCEVWTTITTDASPKFGEWSRGKWQHAQRIGGEFEIVADLLHIEFGGDGVLDFALEIKDAQTMEFWIDDKSFTFKRMDWLPVR